MTTNITPEHKQQFEALTSGEYGNFALFSCFINGEPGAAICAVNRDDDGMYYNITPLFVSVTPEMELTDHDNRHPSDRQHHSDRQTEALCHCSNPGCPVEHGSKACGKRATVDVFRVDMDDQHGTPMCADCAADALASGVFDTRFV